MDVCACPGGKILGAAINAEGVGEFRAYDLHESKLSLIEASAARLGVEICAVAADATVLRQKDTEWADRLICDVPCSGLGVLGQKPDLRYHPRETTQGGQTKNTLPVLQAEILETVSAYLRKGGRLLYSTCTLLREENSAVVEAFLARHTEFSPVDFSVGGLSSEKGMLQLLPQVHGTDGFFMALLEKR